MSEITTALISVFGGITVAGLSYLFTKKHEREAELRKEKLGHYKDFVASLSGIIANEGTPDGQRAFALACNKLMLVAPQSVIDSLLRFQQEIKITNTNKSLHRHDELMSALFFEMRKDLNVSPADNAASFQVGLWASGAPPRDANN